jgi:hypothetical protein
MFTPNWQPCMNNRPEPTECPHCEYDRRFPGFEFGGWMQTDNNGPIVPCPMCNPNETHPMIDESYVREIIKAAEQRGPMEPSEFRRFCDRDIAAGYAAEVAEAERRLRKSNGQREGGP